MPKINVYLPDELAEAVRESGLPVSAICQRALEQAVRRVATIREAVLGDLDPGQLADRLPRVTARTITLRTLAAERAEAAGRTAVTTGDILAGLLGEGGNLALQVLTAMDVSPTSLAAPSDAEPRPGGDGLRFSTPAAIALELAVGEAVGLGNNYVGTEHVLIGLVAEPDGAAGDLLRSRGVEARSTRQAVAAALAGYVAHARNAPATAGLLTAVRAEIAGLAERIGRLEARVG
jgi:ATP-dependent Clp protease ATP-binding subunit ClpC